MRSALEFVFFYRFSKMFHGRETNAHRHNGTLRGGGGGRQNTICLRADVTERHWHTEGSTSGGVKQRRADKSKREGGKQGEGARGGEKEHFVEISEHVAFISKHFVFMSEHLAFISKHVASTSEHFAFISKWMHSLKWTQHVSK